MLLLVLPWFIAIMSRTGEAFFAESAGQDLWGKVFHSAEGHGAPPGFYFVLFWLTFWPAAPLAAVAAPAIWRHRRESATRFLLAWVVPSWIVFELVITKLPHYVLPLYPAIAILVAREIDRGELSANPHLVRNTVAWPVFTALLPVLGGRRARLHARPVRLGGVAVRGLRDDLRLLCVAALRCRGGRALAGAGDDRRAIPGDRALRRCGAADAADLPSQMLADFLKGSGCEDPVIAAVGYHEPSLVFLVGTHTRLVDAAQAAEILRGGACRFALIDSRQERLFAQRAELIGLRYSLRGRLDNAFNINGGRAISIAVYGSGRDP